MALARYKLDRQCADCDRHFDKAYHLDFDHRPGETKLFNISKFGSRNIVSIWREVAKCDVVCALCHRTRTYERAQADPDYGRWQYLEGWGTPEDQLALWEEGDHAG
jgi:DNA polymerase/3'-5' exonuclease PolX